MSIHVFGLTGGIGSGKSAVARRFRERGLPVVDADVLAREVVAPGSEGLVRLSAAFGSQLIQSDGTLDRKSLGALVFADPAARRTLEGITHPLIRALSQRKFAELDAAGEPLACYEVPLLFEAGLESLFEPVVVVSAPDAVRIARASERDAASEQSIEARIRAQLPLEEKVRRAAFVIDNAGTLAETFACADRVHDAICARFGIDARRYPLPAAARN